MSIRKIKTRAQKNILHNNRWKWAYNRFWSKVQVAHKRFDDHLREAMGAAREGLTYTRVSPQ